MAWVAKNLETLFGIMTLWCSAVSLRGAAKSLLRTSTCSAAEDISDLIVIIVFIIIIVIITVRYSQELTRSPWTTLIHTVPARLFSLGIILIFFPHPLLFFIPVLWQKFCVFYDLPHAYDGSFLLVLRCFITLIIFNEGLKIKDHDTCFFL